MTTTVFVALWLISLLVVGLLALVAGIGLGVRDRSVELLRAVADEMK